MTRSISMARIDRTAALVVGLAAGIAGCGTSPFVGGGVDGGADGSVDSGLPGPMSLVATAALAGVSADQKILAYYSPGTATLANGQITGTLSVTPNPPSAMVPPAKLDDGAFSASFSRTGSTLLYLTGQVASQDMGSTAIYGALHIWTPMLSSPVKLSVGLAGHLVTPSDGAWVLFWDVPAPMQGGTGKVSFARAADCSANACKAVELTPQPVQVVAMTASQDGRYAAWQVKSGMGIQAKLQTFLFSVADAKLMQVAETTVAPGVTVAPMAFSPDGNLLATTVTAMMFIPLQLQVINTATFAADPAWKQPAMAATVEAHFADATTLIAHEYTIKGFTPTDDGLHKVTAGGAARFSPGVDFFEIPQQPAGANRFLFAANGGGKGTIGVQLYDLGAMMPAPISLSSATSGFPAISDDLKSAEFLDTYDPNTRTGTLTVAGLPGGERTTIAAGVSIFSAAFADGSSKVVYIDKPDATGAGTLTVWSAGTATVVAHNVIDFRSRKAPDTLYFAVTQPDMSVTPARTPGIYSIALH